MNETGQTHRTICDISTWEHCKGMADRKRYKLYMINTIKGNYQLDKGILTYHFKHLYNVSRYLIELDDYESRGCSHDYGKPYAEEYTINKDKTMDDITNHNRHRSSVVLWEKCKTLAKEKNIKLSAEPLCYMIDDKYIMLTTSTLYAFLSEVESLEKDEAAEEAEEIFETVRGKYKI